MIFVGYRSVMVVHEGRSLYSAVNMEMREMVRDIKEAIPAWLSRCGLGRNDLIFAFHPDRQNSDREKELGAELTRAVLEVS